MRLAEVAAEVLAELRRGTAPRALAFTLGMPERRVAQAIVFLLDAGALEFQLNPSRRRKVHRGQMRPSRLNALIRGARLAPAPPLLEKESHHAHEPAANSESRAPSACSAGDTETVTVE